MIVKYMKKLLVLILVFVISTLSYGHSGRTDSKGGHKNHKTNTYHYHNRGFRR